jgi:adenylate cyclase
LSPEFRALLAGQPVDAVRLNCARRRIIHLPWFGALVSGCAWLFCIPVFLVALISVGQPLDPALLRHLPVSFLVSAFISVTQSFFLVELASHAGLFPLFFQDVRADQMDGIYPLSLRGRGLMWAVSAGICPIGALLLLDFAPPTPGGHSLWFTALVGFAGIGFGLFSAFLINWLVARPVDELRTAARAVADGRLDVKISLNRADEFGALIGEFNHMVAELRGKELLRRTFGVHVGQKAMEQILVRDPGLSGIQQDITAMFVDIRAFTHRAAAKPPQNVVSVLNEFLQAMGDVVEKQHNGMINKFLGDGFMALFGADVPTDIHADEAVRAAWTMLRRLKELNKELAARGEEPLSIGIGINTGMAIVGSIGWAERRDFTAIGNTVNVASRIEGLTKVVGETVLLSEETRAALQFPTMLKQLPPQWVKGVDVPLTVWALDVGSATT